MIEKTEGDAALRVNSGEPGKGLQAYMRVYLWFAGTTGMALTEKSRGEAKARHGETVCGKMFQDLFTNLREYAQQRRLE